MPSSDGLGLSTAEGLRLARKLLRPQLPHDLHDYVLEGICKAVDGSHVLAVTKTGGGKSGYIFGYILLLRALKKLSPPCSLLKKMHPENPAMVVVYPTKGLEEEMETKFLKLDIRAVAINEDTLAAARRSNRNLWQECIEEASLVLLSPEQLSSQPFDRLLQHPKFASRVCALGIDEVHLVHDWGDPSFRDAFRQIGLIHARMPRRTVIIGLTATLLAGQETAQLLDTLGLVPGSFFFQRRSNIRRDVQDIYRILRHSLSAWAFPDLDWIIEGSRKTIIYCANFALCFRLRIYYYSKAPSKVVRIYNSLCDSRYNSETRRLFVEDPATQIIIATDALVVGIDFPNVEDVVDLECKHPNHGKQRKGRAGRAGGDVRDPRGITYVTKTTMEKAKKMVEKRASHDGGKSFEQGLHIGQARLLLSDCYPNFEDVLYENPAFDPPCFCETCVALLPPPASRPECNCSRCIPEPTLPPIKRVTTTLPPIPMDERLTEKMFRVGGRRLEQFRNDLWDIKQSDLRFMPPVGLLPDLRIKNILDNFARIQTEDDLHPYINDIRALSGQESRLFSVILELRTLFKTMPHPKRRKVVAPPVGRVSDAESSTSMTVSTQPLQSIPLPNSLPNSTSAPSYDTFWSTFTARPPVQALISTPMTSQPVTGIAYLLSQPLTSNTILSNPAPPSKRSFTEETNPGIPLSPRKLRRSKRGKENINT